jgi:hypothetical protein
LDYVLWTEEAIFSRSGLTFSTAYMNRLWRILMLLDTHKLSKNLVSTFVLES